MTHRQEPPETATRGPLLPEQGSTGAPDPEPSGKPLGASTALRDAIADSLDWLHLALPGMNFTGPGSTRNIRELIDAIATQAATTSTNFTRTSR